MVWKTGFMRFDEALVSLLKETWVSDCEMR